jgi:endoglucanase
MLVQYLVERRVTSAFYWSWNPNSRDTGGLLQDDWQTVWPDKLALLQRLWSASRVPLTAAAPKPPPATVGALPAPPPVPPVPAVPPRESLAPHTLSTLSDWGVGYCASVEVRNPAATTLAWSLTLPVDGRITQSWNAAIASTANGSTRFTGVDWNARLDAGAGTHFGFCAAREAKPSAREGAAPAATREGIRHQLVVDSEWKEGYCARVVVQNTGSTAQPWRVSLPVSGRIQNLWKARYTLRDGQLTAEGEDYNRVLAPGAETDFGFCAMR